MMLEIGGKITVANITANTNPELKLEMEALDRNTPAHFSQFNERNQQLLDNDKALLEEIIGKGLTVVDGCLCVEYERED